MATILDDIKNELKKIDTRIQRIAELVPQLDGMGHLSTQHLDAMGKKTSEKFVAYRNDTQANLESIEKIKAYIENLVKWLDGINLATDAEIITALTSGDHSFSEGIKGVCDNLNQVFQRLGINIKADLAFITEDSTVSFSMDQSQEISKLLEGMSHAAAFKEIDSEFTSYVLGNVKEVVRVGGAGTAYLPYLLEISRLYAEKKFLEGATTALTDQRKAALKEFVKYLSSTTQIRGEANNSLKDKSYEKYFEAVFDSKVGFDKFMPFTLTAGMKLKKKNKPDEEYTWNPTEINYLALTKYKIPVINPKGKSEMVSIDALEPSENQPGPGAGNSTETTGGTPTQPPVPRIGGGA